MVRTKRLYLGPSVGVAAFAAVYTAPANETIILKHIVAACTSSPSTSGFLEVRSGATGVNLLAVTGAHPFIFRENCWIVLQPGDQLRVWQSVAAAWSWCLSGAELEGVAD